MRETSVEEMQARVGELREELFNLRFRNSMKQLDNPLKIRESRREMARLLTVLNEMGSAAPATTPATEKAPAARATRGRARAGKTT
jgi:large subunit ribosomal protein L29